MMMIPESLPPELAQLVRGCRWQQNRDGMSGVAVYHLERLSSPDFYLKVSADPVLLDLRPEYERLKWLRGKLPVPEVLYFGQDDERQTQYLLMTALPGRDASQPVLLREPARLVRLLAEGLQMIHAVDWRDCPFMRPLDLIIADAQKRVEGGEVDENDFDDERQGWTARSAFAHMLAARPPVEEWCFVHGDYCLPNILIHNNRISGFIDWGRAGVADRYQDLALAERSILYNLSPQWVQPFFVAYRLDDIDEERINFYKLLDEFF